MPSAEITSYNRTSGQSIGNDPNLRIARHTTRIRPRLGCRGSERNRLFWSCGETFGQPSPYLRLDPYTSPLQGREHELDSQSGESRRIAVSASPFRTLTPHLYSQQTVRAGERDRDGQQHRRA